MWSPRTRAPTQRGLATIVDLGVDEGDVALLLALLVEDGPERAGDELPADAAVVRAWAAGPAPGRVFRIAIMVLTTLRSAD